MPPDNNRPTEITIDVSGILFPTQLHKRLARALGFPAYYGRNWDAFWDAITELVPMPHRLILTGWPDLQSRHPEHARQLHRCLTAPPRATREDPATAATVEYR